MLKWIFWSLGKWRYKSYESVFDSFFFLCISLELQGATFPGTNKLYHLHVRALLWILQSAEDNSRWEPKGRLIVKHDSLPFHAVKIVLKFMP